MFPAAEPRISKLTLGPYDTNCYVVSCPDSGEAVVIDTPAEAPRILAETAGLKVKYILITHSHPDHLGALVEVRAALGAPVAVHPGDAPALPQPADLDLQDGVEVKFGRLALKVVHTPGHTPGSVCLLYGEHLFAGDTLFPGGPGHTRSPDAFQQEVASIVSKLLPLSDPTNVYPGHGAGATIGQARKEYAAFAGRPHPPDLYGDVLWASS